MRIFWVLRADCLYIESRILLIASPNFIYLFIHCFTFIRHILYFLFGIFHFVFYFLQSRGIASQFLRRIRLDLSHLYVFCPGLLEGLFQLLFLLVYLFFLLNKSLVFLDIFLNLGQVSLLSQILDFSGGGLNLLL